MSNNLISERDERTKRRKKFKQKVDKIYNLSYKDDEKMMLSVDGAMKLSDTSIRLLDEGAVVGDDFISFIIKKGALEKFLNGKNEVLPNIDPNEKYTVNLGHQEFATFPFIIGEYRASDLSLVDIGDDRHGIDVELHLDEDSVFVKELRRQPYDIGVSAEFNYHVDWDTTFEIGILVIDEVYIFAYGLVGECGNVNSSGLELKGDFMKKDELKELIETENPDEEKKELGVEEIDITVNEEEEAEAETAEETAEETEEAETEADAEAEEEEAEEEESEEEADSEEGTDEEAEDGDEADADEAEDESEEELSIVEGLKERIQTLESTIAELTEANAKLKKTNRKLNNKIQNELEKKEKFKERIKGLSVELLPDEDKKPNEEKKNAVNREYIRSGIGEI